MTIKRILAWADAHHKRTGAWPQAYSGPVKDAPGETWLAVDGALKMGNRGLPGGSSLARLLAQKRRVRNRKDVPRFTVKEILMWADAHAKRTGRRPAQYSGPVHGRPGETWNAVDKALRRGTRGLAGGSSLSMLQKKHGR